MNIEIVAITIPLGIAAIGATWKLAEKVTLRRNGKANHGCIAQQVCSEHSGMLEARRETARRLEDVHNELVQIRTRLDALVVAVTRLETHKGITGP